MKTTKNESSWWRTLLMVPVAVFAIASILATGHDDDDDPPVNGDIPGTVQLAATSFDTGEGTVVNVIVTRSGGSSGVATVDYATADATATAGSDYTSTSGTLTWADGVSGNQTISITIADDGPGEVAESFTVTLSNASGATLGANSSATVNILEGAVVPPTILSQYNFSFGAIDSMTPWTASVGAIGSVSVDLGTTLLGTINLDVSGTGDVTLLSTTTSAGSSFTSTGTTTVPGLEALNGTAVVSVTSAISANAFADPTSGSFEITTTPPLGTITVDIGTTTVDINLNGAGTTSYTWEEFTDLLGSPSAQPHEQVASLMGGVFEFIYELALEAADNIDDLELITLNNPTVEQCDMFTGTQPPMVLAQGQVTATWTGSGELLPGQDFNFDFDDCWLSDSEELLNGVIQAESYIEDVDASNTITRVGFERIRFLDYTIAETEEDMTVFTIDPSATTTVNGGFTLIFSAP
ncbi:MAG: Calx-beta domain-containing protein [Gammaproteobacteria bacterium]